MGVHDSCMTWRDTARLQVPAANASQHLSWCKHGSSFSARLCAVDAKDAVKGAASSAAAGAQRMAGLEPKQGTHDGLMCICCNTSHEARCTSCAHACAL